MNSSEEINREALNLLHSEGAELRVDHIPYYETVLALATKAAKLHSAILLLSRVNAGTEIVPLLRTQFETLMVLAFLAPDELVLSANGVTHSPSAGAPLDRATRYNRYAAHHRRERQRALAEALELPLSPSLRAEREAELAAFEQAMASQPQMDPWPNTERLYGFRSLQLTAVALGLGALYNRLYRQLSWSTHSIDPEDHVTFKDDHFSISLVSPAEDVERLTYLSTRLLALALLKAAEPLGWDTAKLAGLVGYKGNPQETEDT